MFPYTTLPPPEGMMIRWSSQGELFVELQVPTEVYSEILPSGLSIPVGKLRPGMHRVVGVVCVPVKGSLPRYVGRVRICNDTQGSIYLGNQLPQMNPEGLRSPGIVPDNQVTPDLLDAAMHFPVQSLDGPAAPGPDVDLELDCGALVLDFYDSLGDGDASPDLVAETLELLRTVPELPDGPQPPSEPPSEPPSKSRRKPKARQPRAKPKPKAVTAPTRAPKAAGKRGTVRVSTVDRARLRAQVDQLHNSVIASSGVHAIRTVGCKTAATPPSGSTTTCGASGSIMCSMTAASPAAPPPRTAKISA